MNITINFTASTNTSTPLSLTVYPDGEIDVVGPNALENTMINRCAGVAVRLADFRFNQVMISTIMDDDTIKMSTRDGLSAVVFQKNAIDSVNLTDVRITVIQNNDPIH